MKIDNHAVAMNAQYYNVQFESTNAKIIQSEKNFNKDDSQKLEALQDTKSSSDRSHRELSQKLSSALVQNLNSDSRRVLGDGIEVTHTYAEAQALNFSVNAYVQADGREIELQLDVSLSRSFVRQTKIRHTLPKNLQDPLIINLEGKMPTLSSKTFSFDIDSDGTRDQVSQLASGNLFLALDKNENGKIDNGSELFGTKSGDGFADLRIYDEDNNGWIDENDPIFHKLRVWEGKGSDSKLIALGEVGIGAIFLGNTETPFALKDETNALLGEIRSSSFVLLENGRAGLISQVDLAVNKETKAELNTLESLQKGIHIKNLDALYARETQAETPQDQSSDRIKRIQTKIKTLESDLNKAKEGDKAPIQAQIGALYAQMLSILDTQIKS